MFRECGGRVAESALRAHAVEKDFFPRKRAEEEEEERLAAEVATAVLQKERSDAEAAGLRSSEDMRAAELAAAREQAAAAEGKTRDAVARLEEEIRSAARAAAESESARREASQSREQLAATAVRRCLMKIRIIAIFLGSDEQP